MHRQKTILNRRNFLKKGITGIVGAACLPKTFKANTLLIQEAKENKEFVYRTVGKTGIEQEKHLDHGHMDIFPAEIVKAARSSALKDSM